MHSVFGDYRKKMQEDMKKAQAKGSGGAMLYFSAGIAFGLPLFLNQ